MNRLYSFLSLQNMAFDRSKGDGDSSTHDFWTTKDSLTLASVIQRTGDRNWLHVSRAMKPIGDQSPDWYTPKKVCIQYSKLMKLVEQKGKKPTSRTERENMEDELVKLLHDELVKDLTTLSGECINLQSVFEHLDDSLLDDENTDSLSLSNEIEKFIDIWNRSNSSEIYDLSPDLIFPKSPDVPDIEKECKREDISSSEDNGNTTLIDDVPPIEVNSTPSIQVNTLPSPQPFFNPSSTLASAAAHEFSIVTSPAGIQNHVTKQTESSTSPQNSKTSSPASSVTLSAPTLSKLLEMPPSILGRLPPLPTVLSNSFAVPMETTVEEEKKDIEMNEDNLEKPEEKPEESKSEAPWICALEKSNTFSEEERVESLSSETKQDTPLKDNIDPSISENEFISQTEISLPVAPTGIEDQDVDTLFSAPDTEVLSSESSSTRLSSDNNEQSCSGTKLVTKKRMHSPSEKESSPPLEISFRSPEISGQLYAQDKKAEFNESGILKKFCPDDSFGSAFDSISQAHKTSTLTEGDAFTFESTIKDTCNESQKETPFQVFENKEVEDTSSESEVMLDSLEKRPEKSPPSINLPKQEMPTDTKVEHEVKKDDSSEHKQSSHSISRNPKPTSSSSNSSALLCEIFPSYNDSNFTPYVCVDRSDVDKKIDSLSKIESVTKTSRKESSSDSSSEKKNNLKRFRARGRNTYAEEFTHTLSLTSEGSSSSISPKCGKSTDMRKCGEKKTTSRTISKSDSDSDPDVDTTSPKRESNTVKNIPFDKDIFKKLPTFGKSFTKLTPRKRGNSDFNTSPSDSTITSSSTSSSSSSPSKSTSSSSSPSKSNSSSSPSKSSTSSSSVNQTPKKNSTSSLNSSPDVKTDKKFKKSPVKSAPSHTRNRSPHSNSPRASRSSSSSSYFLNREESILTHDESSDSLSGSMHRMDSACLKTDLDPENVEDSERNRDSSSEESYSFRNIRVPSDTKSKKLPLSRRGKRGGRTTPKDKPISQQIEKNSFQDVKHSKKEAKFEFSNYDLSSQQKQTSDNDDTDKIQTRASKHVTHRAERRKTGRRGRGRGGRGDWRQEGRTHIHKDIKNEEFFLVEATDKDEDGDGDSLEGDKDDSSSPSEGSTKCEGTEDCSDIFDDSFYLTKYDEKKPYLSHVITSVDYRSGGGSSYTTESTVTPSTSDSSDECSEDSDESLFYIDCTSKTQYEKGIKRSKKGLPQYTYKKWKKSICLIWREISYHKYAKVFSQKVTNEVAPGYQSIVNRPMDLSLIKKNIDNGVITTTEEFHRDMLLMFENSIMYNNSDHDVYQMACEMRRDFNNLMENYLATQLVEDETESPTTSPSLRAGRYPIKLFSKSPRVTLSKIKE